MLSVSLTGHHWHPSVHSYLRTARKNHAPCTLTCPLCLIQWNPHTTFSEKPPAPEHPAAPPAQPSHCPLGSHSVGSIPSPSSRATMCPAFALLIVVVARLSCVEMPTLDRAVGQLVALCRLGQVPSAPIPEKEEEKVSIKRPLTCSLRGRHFTGKLKNCTMLKFGMGSRKTGGRLCVCFITIEQQQTCQVHLDCVIKSRGAQPASFEREVVTGLGTAEHGTPPVKAGDPACWPVHCNGQLVHL